VYLRHTTRRKDGKSHVYWRLVRSVRRGGKVVQETVAQLGELDAEGRARAAELARNICGHAQERGQGQLFDSTRPSEALAVKLDGVRLERSRSFGAVWLGLKLWQALKLDEVSREHLPAKRERVPWTDVIALLVIARLCEPSSELYVAEKWYRTTALEDLLGVSAETIYDERLYRALDRLLPHKEAFEKHLAWLNTTKRRYVIGTARTELRRFSKELADKTDWRQIREDVEVKICRGPDGSETFLLCRSASRIEKEKAMHERFSKRIEEGLQSLAQRIEKSKTLLDRGQLERQIGRLLERNSRAAARYSIALSEDPSVAAKVKLQWSQRTEWDDWAKLSEGTYILRSNIQDWTDEELWKTYIQLSEAEAAFRIQKSDLCIRPIWHHKQDRIKAHILICFLAYALWKTMQQWQSRAGLGDSPRTILAELSRIHSADIVLPLADGSKRELRLRCVVRPEREQQLLLQRLGLILPERLRPPAVAQM
jgi:hypothetical protein